MIKLSQEEAVTRFIELMSPFSSTGVQARTILDTALNFYRDYRIKGTNLDDDEDMLLLEWGTYFPNLLGYFTDFRQLSDKDLKYDNRSFQYLGLTRQIFLDTDEELDFDEEAIGISVNIFFHEAQGDEHSSNIWIRTPDETVHKIEQFTQNQFVGSLLTAQPTSVNIFVGYVG